LSPVNEIAELHSPSLPPFLSQCTKNIAIPFASPLLASSHMQLENQARVYSRDVIARYVAELRFMNPRINIM
jgi:hypothetical protein